MNTADKIILIDSTVSIGLYVIALFAYLRGSPLDNLMDKSILFVLYSMVLSFIIAIMITIANLFLLKNATTQWIKFLAFAPIVFSIGLICFGLCFIDRWKK